MGAQSYSRPEDLLDHDGLFFDAFCAGAVEALTIYSLGFGVTSGDNQVADAIFIHGFSPYVCLLCGLFVSHYYPMTDKLLATKQYRIVDLFGDPNHSLLCKINSSIFNSHNINHSRGSWVGKKGLQNSKSRFVCISGGN